MPEMVGGALSPWGRGSVSMKWRHFDIRPCCLELLESISSLQLCDKSSSGQQTLLQESLKSGHTFLTPLLRCGWEDEAECEKLPYLPDSVWPLTLHLGFHVHGNSLFWTEGGFLSLNDSRLAFPPKPWRRKDELKPSQAAALMVTQSWSNRPEWTVHTLERICMFCWNFWWNSMFGSNSDMTLCYVKQ